MKKAFVTSELSPGHFWQALLNVNLVIPLPRDKGRAGERVEWKEGPLPMVMGVDSAGKNVIWVFTSRGSLFDYTDLRLPFVELSTPAVMAMLMRKRQEVFLIGPERLTLHLSPDFMAAMAEGKVPTPEETVKNIPKNMRVRVGEMGDETKALEERFQALFEDLPEVLEAQFIRIADDTGTRPLVGLRLAGESPEVFRRVARMISKASEGVLEKGKSMDVTQIDRSLKEAFKKYGRSFFKRARI